MSIQNNCKVQGIQFVQTNVERQRTRLNEIPLPKSMKGKDFVYQLMILMNIPF